MLPGMRSIGGAVGQLLILTQFYRTSGNVLVPSGYSVARVTAIGGGGRGVGNDGGGGGGAASQSIISVVPGETLSAVFSYNAGGATALARGNSTLIRAASGAFGSDGGAGGAASDGIGTTRYSGGNGYSGHGAGGGAGGLTGNGGNGDYNTGGAAGPGMPSFIQTSDSAVARNGTGGGYLGNGGIYGGGGGSYPGDYTSGGDAIIIIEWGRAS